MPKKVVSSEISANFVFVSYILVVFLYLWMNQAQIVNAFFRNRAVITFVNSIHPPPYLHTTQVRLSKLFLEGSLHTYPNSCASRRILWQMNAVLADYQDTMPPCDDGTSEILTSWALVFGRHFVDIGELEKAISIFQLGTEVGKSKAQTMLYYDLGELWVMNGDYEKALPCFRHVLNTAEDEYILSHANSHIGRMYLELGFLKRAIPYFVTAVELTPENKWVHVNLATAYRLLGNLEAAQLEYQAALAIDPTIKGVKEILESLYAP